MNKESKLNLNASDYAISHCDSDKTYKGPEVHKMLCDAYIAGNNDTLDDKDEEIRKALINVFAMHKDYEVFFGVSVEDIRAWLKKQGEQKSTNIVPIPDGCHAYIKDRKVYIENYTKTTPANKVEPKFKARNWYQCTKDFFGKGVTFDKNTAYYCAKEGCLQNEYGCHIAIVKDLYDNFKLWTIADARDGDILAADMIESHPSPFVAIYKRQDGELFETYCFIGLDGKFYKGEIGHVSEYVHPAIKEQRDTLMKAMTDAGYTFDFEKKELKKIENKKVVFKKDEKSTAWSKNDDYNAQCLIAKVTYDIQKGNVGRNQELIDWVKSLKYRMNND